MRRGYFYSLILTAIAVQDRTAEKTSLDTTSLYVHSDLQGFTPSTNTYGEDDMIADILNISSRWCWRYTEIPDVMCPHSDLRQERLGEDNHPASGAAPLEGDMPSSL